MQRDDIALVSLILHGAQISINDADHTLGIAECQMSSTAAAAGWIERLYDDTSAETAHATNVAVNSVRSCKMTRRLEQRCATGS